MVEIVSTLGRQQLQNHLMRQSQLKEEKSSLERSTMHRESILDISNVWGFFNSQMGIEQLGKTTEANKNVKGAIELQQEMIDAIERGVTEFLCGSVLQDTAVLDVDRLLKREAVNLLELVEGYLNTPGHNGFLFSGDTQDQQPVQNLRTIPIDGTGNIDASTYYFGGTHEHQVITNPDTPNIIVSLSLRADAQPFVDLIKALANAREGNYQTAAAVGQKSLTDLANMRQSLENKRLSLENTVEHIENTIIRNHKFLENQDRLDLVDIARMTEEDAYLQFSKTSTIESQHQNRRFMNTLLDSLRP